MNDYWVCTYVASYTSQSGLIPDNCRCYGQMEKCADLVHEYRTKLPPKNISGTFPGETWQNSEKFQTSLGQGNCGSWCVIMLDRSNGDTSYNQVSRLSINHWLLCTVVLWIFSFWISIRGSTLDFFICFTNISQKIWSYLELAMTSIYMSQSSILERVLSESVRIWPKQTKYSADTLATMIQHNQQGCIEMNSQALTTSTDLVTDIFLCKQLLKFIYINSLNPKILFFFLSLVLTISTLLVQHMRLIFLQKSLKFNPSIGRTKHIILILHLLILSNHQ